MVTIQFTWEHYDVHTFGLSFVKSVACPRIEAHLLEELRFNAHRLELRTLNDYVALYGKRGLAFEPGSRWEYSNYGTPSTRNC